VTALPPVSAVPPVPPGTPEPQGTKKTRTPRAAILLRDLRKDYFLGSEPVHVLKGIDLEVPEGDYVAIMGPSGSGKSTLLNILGCLDKPTGGEFFLGESDVARLDDDSLAAIRASRIGFVFQSYNLIPQLNVIDNIEVPLYYQGAVTPEGRDRCRELATLVGLGQRLDHRPFELSGGQQQRAGIARSLVNNPRYILADEPTGNLDTATTKEVLAILDRLNADGKTIVLVTHEEEVAAHARRIVRLRDGVVQSDVRHRALEAQRREPLAVGGSPSAAGETSNTPHPTSNLPSAPASWRLLLRTFQLGVKSLLLHPLRSLLTILGIFIGVASVIWLLAIGEGISAKAQQQIALLGAKNIIVTSTPPNFGVGTSKRDRFGGITQIDYENLAATVPSIVRAVPSREVPNREFSYGGKRFVGRLIGSVPGYLALNRMEIARGHFLTDTEIQEKAKVCVLSAKMADQLFGYEDPLGNSVRISGDYFRVVGVLRSRDADAAIPGARAAQDFSADIYVPITSLWTFIFDFYGKTQDGIPIVSQVTLELTDQTQVLDTAAIIRQSLAKAHHPEDFTLTVPLELLEQARNTRLMFIAMMGLVAAISLLVGGIGIMNIMLATVTERTREIGIRRAIGARRDDITRQFLVETIVLSIAGGVTGMLGGLACTPILLLTLEFLGSAFPRAMAALPDTVRTMTPIIVPWSLPLAFGISVAVGVVFGLYPARRAAAMNPIEALRHVT
jgi:ABC-type lipoprotein export system ATPase subunit/ABC-type antimicrobial peptide transport system permease subunit